MHKIKFHRRAQRAMRRIPANRSAQILAAIDGLAAMEDPASHRNVLRMKGDMEGRMRMRVGEYRVIFRLKDGEGGGQTLVILVADVGPRGGIYG